MLDERELIPTTLSKTRLTYSTANAIGDKVLCEPCRERVADTDYNHRAYGGTSQPLLAIPCAHAKSMGAWVSEKRFRICGIDVSGVCWVRCKERRSKLRTQYDEFGWVAESHTHSNTTVT